MDGGTLVADILRAHRVPFLFTLCGGHISPILVACKRRGIRVVDVRHEVNAVFSADAVARLTGTPGVAAVTAGPGVTNTITAVKNAQMAQSPLVLLGGATATVLRGRGSLQDIDQVALMEPHVKWVARPDRLREVGPALEQAFEIAMSGVPGPVFVELAVDLLYEEAIVRDWYSKKTDGEARGAGNRLLRWYLRRHLDRTFRPTRWSPRPSPRVPAPPEASGGALRRAGRMVAASERPVMVVGSQTLLDPESTAQLVAAVERLGLPVFLSGMARGLLGVDHPLQVRHKRRMALREADLVLLSGVPCDFRLDYGGHIPRKARLISVSRDPESIRKNRTPTLGVLGDPGRFLRRLAERVADPAASGGAERSRWMERLRARNDARDAEIAAMAAEPSELVNPLQVCLGIERHLADRSILVADGGDFVATASYILKPRGPLCWLDPGVFGTLGVGAGFALGAKLVHPGSDVWLVYGDGSAGYSVAEIDTFVRHGAPVIAVVGNDAGWTQIRRDQVPVLGDDVGCVLERNDYHKVAEGWGGRGFLIDRPEAIDPALAGALEAARAGHPALVNAHIGLTDFRKGSLSM